MDHLEDQIKDRRYAGMFPQLGRDPVPTDPYYSPEWFEKERKAIFSKCWLNVGRVEELPAPGSYLAKTIAVWNNISLLLVHGRDGKIRGFYNVCTHRGNSLVREGSGKSRGFISCPFHGWVFDDKGALVEITDESNFYDPDHSTLGLKPIAVDIWNGFMFANLAPEESLTEYLGELTTNKIAKYPFSQFSTCYTYKANEKVNWKVLLDAQQEGYHVPTLHKRTLSLSFPTTLTRFRSSTMKIIGNKHRLLATASKASDSFVSTPTGTVARKYGSTALEAFAGVGDASAFSDSMEGSFDFQVVFPNFVIGLLYGTYFTYNIWPIAADRSIWEIRFYYSPPKNAGQVFSNEYGKVAFRDGLTEDASTHEGTQRGISSGAIKHFIFQDEETMCRHGYQSVVDMVENFESN